MTRYNTGNPVGSSSPLDLYDNAENLDAGINGPGATWVDRRGQTRKSWNGIETDFQRFLADGSTIEFPTWAAASAAAGAGQIPLNRQVAVVGDGGSHVDPVSGLTVSNSGRYVMVSAGLEWRSADVLSQKEDKAATAPLLSGVGTYTSKQSLVPLAVVGSSIVAWIEGGMIGAAGVTPDLRRSIRDEADTLSGITPVVSDGVRVPVWLDGGLLDAVGIGPRLQQLLDARFGTGGEPSVTGRLLPLRTDGGSLRRWRAKLARIKAGAANVQARLTLLGDSWAEKNDIPSVVRNMLAEIYGRAGSGFINTVNYADIGDGITVARTGTWVIYDADVSNQPPAQGSGPNGNSITSSEVGAAFDISGMAHGTTLRVWFGALEGSFSYTLDGREDTTVTPNPAGDPVQFVDVALPAPGPNRVTLTVRSGTVALYGAFNRSGAGAGVEVSHVGNGGVTGTDYLHFVDAWTPYFVGHMDADLALVILGTNDYRLSKGSVANYRAALQKLVAVYRQGRPDMGFVFIAPPQSNATAVVPLSAYRDAMYMTALEVGAEFYNANEAWSTYAVENANGMWNDPLHLNSAGATRLAFEGLKDLITL